MVTWTKRSIHPGLSYPLSVYLLQAYVFLVPFEAFLSDFINLVVVSMGVAVLLERVREPPILISKVQLITIVGITLFFALALAITPFVRVPFVHLFYTRTLVVILIVVSTFTVSVTSIGRLRAVLSSILASAALVGVLTVVHVIIGLPIGNEILPMRDIGPFSFGIARTLGVLMPYGYFGTYAGIGAAFALSMIVRPQTFVPKPSRQLRYAAALCLCLVLTAVYIGQSRSTLVAFFGLFSLFLTVLIMWRISSLFVGAVILSVVALILGVTDVIGLIIEVNPRTVSYRFTQYEFALSLATSEPFTGTGIRYPSSALGSQIHNFWLARAAETGFIGMLIWLTLFITAGAESLKQSFHGRSTAKILGLVAACALFAGSAELMLYAGFNQMIGVLFGTVGCALSVATRCA